MSWSGSARRSELPSNWTQIRNTVLEEEGFACRICGGEANQVDHIGDRMNHERANLQALCEQCHRRKTALEGQMARYRLAPVRGKRFEPHPGMRGAR
ncbi:HNH endonuclease [Micromonospora sp. NBC_01813]|uniref:HNH endonuclease n=1 Tax=Micromonospora sp. NBC_01813 TaxID=2975988 RepID=UPI003FA344E6